MNKTLCINIALAAVVLSGTIIFAQEKPVSGKLLLDSKEKTSKILIRAKAKADFVGIVTQVDPIGKTVAVKNKGVAVTFDAANPILKGYKSLEQVKRGDRIAISYTADGTRISRATGTEEMRPEDTVKPGPELAKPKQEVAKTNKGRPVRIRERTNSWEFRDVDNNSDGKITPVELCVVVPNLTIEDFRRYDKDTNGSLNQSEYNALKKSLTHDR